MNDMGDLLWSTFFPDGTPVKFAICFVLLILIIYCLRLFKFTRHISSKLSSMIKSVPYFLLGTLITAYYMKNDCFDKITVMNAFTLIFCYVEAADNLFQGVFYRSE